MHYALSFFTDGQRELINQIIVRHYTFLFSFLGICAVIVLIAYLVGKTDEIEEKKKNSPK